MCNHSKGDSAEIKYKRRKLLLRKWPEKTLPRVIFISWVLSRYRATNNDHDQVPP